MHISILSVGEGESRLSRDSVASCAASYRKMGVRDEYIASLLV